MTDAGMRTNAFEATSYAKITQMGNFCNFECFFGKKFCYLS